MDTEKLWVKPRASKKILKAENFFVWLKSRGLDGGKLIIGDKNLGILKSIGDVSKCARYHALHGAYVP